MLTTFEKADVEIGKKAMRGNHESE
jgi:hypothetical protein